MERLGKSSSRIRGTTPEVERAARRLRRQLTPAEERLWAAPQGKRLGGLKFRLQHPVGYFVLDFYCPSRKLVVEVDGPVHADPGQAIQDDLRTEHLAAYGCRVVRVTNEEIFDDLDDVLERISRLATDG